MRSLMRYASIVVLAHTATPEVGSGDSDCSRTLQARLRRVGRRGPAEASRRAAGAAAGDVSGRSTARGGRSCRSRPIARRTDLALAPSDRVDIGSGTGPQHAVPHNRAISRPATANVRTRRRHWRVISALPSSRQSRLLGIGHLCDTESGDGDALPPGAAAGRSKLDSDVRAGRAANPPVPSPPLAAAAATTTTTAARSTVYLIPLSEGYCRIDSAMRCASICILAHCATRSDRVITTMAATATRTSPAAESPSPPSSFGIYRLSLCWPGAQIPQCAALCAAPVSSYWLILLRCRIG